MRHPRREGDSSWMAVPHLEHFDGLKVLQLRDPIRVIQSFTGTRFFSDPTRNRAQHAFASAASRGTASLYRPPGQDPGTNTAECCDCQEAEARAGIACSDEGTADGQGSDSCADGRLRVAAPAARPAKTSELVHTVTLPKCPVGRLRLRFSIDQAPASAGASSCWAPAGRRERPPPGGPQRATDMNEGRTTGHQWAVLMATPGQLPGRLRAQSHGRRQGASMAVRWALIGVADVSMSSEDRRFSAGLS